ncbi:hypothetical protein BRADI_2g05145v3 [Brachypodium distachyon]|uniref:Uncharacterized protein n=1 Tax=Brachypodium distachyon TaxID=15368 RepID=A0A2K2D727_BRADI|nr:hypothetical protein BRADI_2g05145v3 [Brachypodium distachyon]
MASRNDYGSRGSPCYGARPMRGTVLIDNSPTSARAPPCAMVRTWVTSRSTTLTNRSSRRTGCRSTRGVHSNVVIIGSRFFVSAGGVRRPAGLLQLITPARCIPRVPDETAKSSACLSQASSCIYTNSTFRSSRPTRLGDRVGMAMAKATLNGACTVLYTGSVGTHIITTHTCIGDAKRRHEDDHNSLIGGFSQV